MGGVWGNKRGTPRAWGTSCGEPFNARACCIVGALSTVMSIALCNAKQVLNTSCKNTHTRFAPSLSTVCSSSKHMACPIGLSRTLEQPHGIRCLAIACACSVDRIKAAQHGRITTSVMNLDDEDVPLIVEKRRRLSEPAGHQELTIQSIEHNVRKTSKGSSSGAALHVVQCSQVRFLEDKDDNKHFQKCSKRSCSRCQWVRRRKGYRKGTPMHAAITDADKASLNPDGQILSLASWCVSASVDGKWGLGCAACSKLPKERVACSKLRKWAQHKACRRRLNGWALLRHARTMLHVGAVAQLLGTHRGPTGASVCGAPPISDFEELLAHMEKGESGRQTAQRQSKTATSTKTTQMRWAVVEAMREKDRLFLKQAVTIALARDERRSRLLVRYSACDAKLNVRRGFMGQARGAGGKALQVVDATRKVLKDFCTVNHGAPDGVKTVWDQALYNHIRSKIEMVVSDSASNEGMAADIGRGRRLPQLAGGGDLPLEHPARGDTGNPSRDGNPVSDVRSSLACLTPNLMIVGRDLAHGFRRSSLTMCAQTCNIHAHTHEPVRLHTVLQDIAETIRC